MKKKNTFYKPFTFAFHVKYIYIFLMHRVLLCIPGWLVTCDPHAPESWVHHRDWLKYSGTI